MWLPAPPRFSRWLGWQAAIQALRSASGQSSIESDRTVAFSDDSICCGDITVPISGIFRELDVVADDLAKGLVRLRRFESAIEIDGGLDVAVTQQSLHGFVFARTVLEVDSPTGVAKLMDRYPQAGRLLNALRDLLAEHVRRLRLTGDAGEQPAGI